VSTLGKYEVVLRTALEQSGPGPWNQRDIRKAKGTLTQGLCVAVDQECDKDAVIDWLATLTGADVRDLVRRLNAN
jgi:hypothetical protein